MIVTGDFTLDALVRLITGLAVLTLAVIHLLLWASFRRPLMARWASVLFFLGAVDLVQTLLRVKEFGETGRIVAISGIVLMIGFLGSLVLALLGAVGEARRWARTVQVGAVGLLLAILGWLLATEPPELGAHPASWYMPASHPALVGVIMACVALAAAISLRAAIVRRNSLALWMISAGILVGVIRSPVLAQLRDVGLSDGISPIQVLLTFTITMDVLLVGVGSVLLVLEQERANAVATATREERAERMERLGLMAGSIAHDMNNVLASVMGGVSLARDPGATPAEIQEDLAAVEVALEHGRDMTKRLLSFAKGAAPFNDSIELASWLVETETSLRYALGPPHELRLVIAERDLQVRVDPIRLRQLLLNTVLNSRDAAAPGRTVRITVSLARRLETRERALGVFTLAPGEWVELRIEDDGPGFPAEALDKVFEPFFTTKGAGGTGLGLATVFAIVRDAKGGVQASNGPEGGAVVEVWFPLQRATY